MTLLSLFFIFCIINAIICLTLGLFIFLKNIKNLLNQVWGLFSLASFLWLLGFGMMIVSNNKNQALFWLKYVYYLGLNFMPITFVHFCLILTEMNKKQKILIKLLYLLGIFLQIATFGNLMVSVKYHSLLKFYTKAELIYPIFLCIFLFLFLYSALIIFKSINKITGYKKKQLIYFLIALLIGILTGSTAFFPVFNVPIFPFGIFIFPLYPLLLTYTIFRYQFLDIQIIIKRSTLYASMIILITAFYFTIVFLSEKIFLSIFGYQLTQIRFIAVIIIAFIFLPIRNQIEKIIDNIFYKKKIEYMHSLHDFSRKLITIINLQELITIICENIFEIIKIKNIGFFIYQEKMNYYNLKYCKGFKNNNIEDKIYHNNSTLIIWLKTNKKILYSFQINYKDLDIQEQFKKIEADLIIPLVFNDKLLGFISLGKKYNEEPYNSEELRLFESFGNQAAISLSNAIIYDNFHREHDDLVDLKNSLEQKVIDRTKKLEDSHKQKIDFINNVLHEIRTPVTILTNSLNDFIKKGGRSSDIEIVKNNADKLEKDVLSLLDTQKFEIGKHFYDHDQIINIGDMLINKIVIFTPVANKKNIKITRNIPENDIYIKIDPYAMDRVINNMLDNAIRYTKEDGVIDVILKEEGEKVNLIINDTGIGISEEQQKHIFEPYYQISRKKSNIQGLGMGLNIVKRILDEVNAEIKVKSKLNNGTSFIITFNTYKLLGTDRVIEDIKYSEAINSVIAVKLKEEIHKAGRSNVLVVEDDLNMLFYLQNSMYDIYNFYYAKNGREAIEKLEKIPKPDIIISDIMMDEMDGYSFYDNLCIDKRFKYIPILFLTAISRKEEKIKGLSKGAIDFITKPFSIDELLAKVSSILKIEEGKRERDIIELADEVRNYLINKVNNNDLGNKNKDDEEIEQENNALDKVYIEYGISKREVEILDLLFKGFIRKEIAYKLDISVNTVKTYMSRIFAKCSVDSKKDLLKIFDIQNS